MVRSFKVSVPGFDRLRLLPVVPVFAGMMSRFPEALNGRKELNEPMA
jgi:hypothetical protein